MSINRQTLLDEGVNEGKAMSRTRRHRLTRFADWADESKLLLEDIGPSKLAEYAMYLISTYSLSTASVIAHLSTVRARLRELGNNKLEFKSSSVFPMEAVFDLARTVGTPKNQEEWDDEIARAELQAKRISRLDSDQLNELVHSPGFDTLQGLRDTALIGLMGSTGIREMELPRLDVGDLYQSFEGLPALRIPTEDGGTDRVVPYGILLRWGLLPAALWLEQAGITEGPVFRGLYKGGQKLRPGRMGISTIEHILSRYPIYVRGFQIPIKPLVLRRTYAAHMYHGGIDIPTLQRFLGLKSSDAVIAYIGLDDSAQDMTSTPRVIHRVSKSSPLEQLAEDSEIAHMLQEFFEGLKK